MPEKWNKVEQEVEQEVEQGIKNKKFVPLRGGTRKKFVPLFNPSRSTPKKPKNIDATYDYKTQWNKWNKWNNSYKKWLGTWKNRICLQEYRDI